MKKLPTLAALVALTSLSAFAQDKPEAKPEAKAEAKPKDEAKKADRPKQTPEERFKNLDKDGNGSLSIDEFRGKREASVVEAAFKALDTNGDGAVSLDEYVAGAQKKPRKKE